jgi:hypothetical protein
MRSTTWIGLAALALSCGCSLAFVKRAPPAAAPGPQVACTDTKILPVADAVVGTAMVIGAVGISRSDIDPDARNVVSPLYGVVGLGLIYSAYVGFRETGRCQTLRASLATAPALAIRGRLRLRRIRSGSGSGSGGSAPAPAPGSGSVPRRASDSGSGSGSGFGSGSGSGSGFRLRLRLRLRPPSRLRRSIPTPRPLHLFRPLRRPRAASLLARAS